MFNRNQKFVYFLAKHKDGSLNSWHACTRTLQFKYISREEKQRDSKERTTYLEQKYKRNTC